MEYSQAKFKQLAVEFALKIPTVEGNKSPSDMADELVAKAKVIEAYLVDSE